MTIQTASTNLLEQVMSRIKYIEDQLASSDDQIVKKAELLKDQVWDGCKM